MKALEEASQALEQRVRSAEARNQRMEAHWSVELQARTNALSDIAWPAAWAKDLGADDVIPIPRVLPARVYIGEPADHAALAEFTALRDAIAEAFSTLQWEFATDYPVERGSVFKRWFVKTEYPTTPGAVNDRLQKVERAMELQGLAGPQANVDYVEAQAAATVIGALPRDVPAAAQIGSLLVINLPGQAFMSRTLTTNELIQLERNQDVLKDPATILDRLKELSVANDEAQKRSGA